MNILHTHDWINQGQGTTACAATGCRAVRHEHRYTQHAGGQWRCGCGAWTPKPPQPPDRVIDLSTYNVGQFTPRRPRTARKQVRSR
jgi:hypothetical protein